MKSMLLDQPETVTVSGVNTNPASAGVTVASPDRPAALQRPSNAVRAVPSPPPRNKRTPVIPAPLESVTRADTEYGPTGKASKFTLLAAPETVMLAGVKVHPCPSGMTVTVPRKPVLLQYPPPEVAAVPNAPLNGRKDCVA